MLLFHKYNYLCVWFVVFFLFFFLKRQKSVCSRLQPDYPTNFLSTQQEAVGSSFILYPIKQTHKGSCHKLQNKDLETEFGKAGVTIPSVEIGMNINASTTREIYGKSRIKITRRKSFSLFREIQTTFCLISSINALGGKISIITRTLI